MSCLYLTEDDVAGLISMPLAIEVMEEMFGRLAAGQATNVPRVRAQGKGIVLHSMCAAADYLGLVGWKQYTTTARGAIFHVGLYDYQSGKLVALVDANRLGQVRTGAVTGLAARLLANPGTSQVGLLGAGFQAETQLAAVKATLPIKRAVVYSRRANRRREFAERLSRELGIEVVPASAPHEAVDGMPLVITVTNSLEPVLDGQRLAHGALVAAVGSNWLNKAELDVTTISRAESIVCDSRAACQHEAGDFTAALAAGVFDWPRTVELADVVSQKHPGRLSPGGIVLLKSVGLAVEDVALAGKLMQLARQRGVGRTLPIG